MLLLKILRSTTYLLAIWVTLQSEVSSVKSSQYFGIGPRGVPNWDRKRSLLRNGFQIKPSDWCGLLGWLISKGAICTRIVPCEFNLEWDRLVVGLKVPGEKTKSSCRHEHLDYYGKIRNQNQSIADRVAKILEIVFKTFNLVPGEPGFSWDFFFTKCKSQLYIVLIS